MRLFLGLPRWARSQNQFNDRLFRPLNASSVLGIVSWSHGIDGRVLFFDSILGRHYTAEFTTNLMKTNWNALIDYTNVVSTGGILRVTDTNAFDRVFYRITVHQ